MRFQRPAVFLSKGILAGAGVLLVLLLLLAGVASPNPTPAYVQRVSLQARAADDGYVRPVSGTAGAPLIVIDAGHGGADPGAVGGDGIMEKTVVLELANTLRRALLEQGGVRVAMTRDDDRFIPLAERTAIARAMGADLFISIHADSGGDEQNAAGASIYTLSAQASGRQAERFAQRENSADVVNGIALATGNNTVDTILFEMSQRRALAEAAEFARLIVRESEGQLRFRDPPRRSAALAVLTAPDVPSILFEVGFVTNPQEAARMTSREGREQFARVTAAAVRSFLANRAPRSPADLG